jgi:hypothetical protein
LCAEEFGIRRLAPHENSVDFSLRVDTAVHSSVRIVEVPQTLIDIDPAWRRHYFFVARHRA